MKKKPELTAADLRVGQMVAFGPNIFKLESIGLNGVELEIDDIGSGWLSHNVIKPCYTFSEIKPILRRLDSMTLEEAEEYQSLCWEETYEYASSDFHDTIESVIWLIGNNFDVRGWIDAGLAIDAATLEGDANV